MGIVVTGASGFVGKNLLARLGDLRVEGVRPLGRASTTEELVAALAGAELVFHLAGVNRPDDPQEFWAGNVGYTEELLRGLKKSGSRARIVYASSIQAELDNPYGRSKREAEHLLLRYAEAEGVRVHLLRLPNVFGKWCRPRYNSVVATFCYQVARNLPLTINDPTVHLRLIHIDDLVSILVSLIGSNADGEDRQVAVTPVYETTVGDLADALKSFAASRATLAIPRVGDGLLRALYSTYVSYLPEQEFSYAVAIHSDSRGDFVEMLKTPDCGQWSYFTAHPGVTRGGHYHHCKTEKFLVIRGTALFRFRNVDSGQQHELTVRGREGRIVDTAPGWAHDITNVGSDELVVMLWANEIFDRARPDTVASRVAHG